MMMQKISIQLHADDIIYKPEDIAEIKNTHLISVKQWWRNERKRLATCAK